MSSIDKPSTDTSLISTLVRRLHLLIRQELHAALRASGFDDLTPAHMYVFQSPGPDGMRPGELAARTNMTKQAMNHLLAGLERGGYLTRAPAPGDGRGRVVELTARGREITRIMIEGSERIEDKWARRVGRGRVEEIRRALQELNAVGEEFADAS
ncbi:MAG: MarR family transcriptional regulator [Actinobacteria bacterium]|nr:MarR family transcriptional regulator [Actinomycetota bacterium]